MSFSFQNLTEIKAGLSNKKIYRKYEKRLNKIIIDFSKYEKEFFSFLNIYKILRNINISIPQIYEIYIEQKLIVMEDFGDNSFDKIFNEKNLYYLLKISVDNLIIIQNSLISEDLENLEKYSFNDLKKEIAEFVSYYIPYKKITDFSEDQFYEIWKNIYENQKFEFNSFAHKDFEFINLILLNKNKLHYKCGIIDFQSAFIGFKGWDLFSILENPRINFTRKYNEDLIKYFYVNTNINIEYNSFRSQYYFLNLGRLTRLLGRWAKLLNQSNNNEYLDYINTTEKRIISSLSNVDSEILKKIYMKAITN